MKYSTVVVTPETQCSGGEVKSSVSSRPVRVMLYDPVTKKEGGDKREMDKTLVCVKEGRLKREEAIYMK